MLFERGREPFSTYKSKADMVSAVHKRLQYRGFRARCRSTYEGVRWSIAGNGKRVNNLDLLGVDKFIEDWDKEQETKKDEQ